MPESANYTFSVSCGDECELWFKEFEETRVSFEDGAASHPEKEEIMLVQLQRWASYDESDA